jgi:hypothetical protein
MHIIRHVRPETFRRVCMSFDAWVVGYGVSTLLRQLHLVETAAAFTVLAAVGLLDIWLLYQFFRKPTAERGDQARRSRTRPMSVSPANADPSDGNGRLTAAASSRRPLPARTPTAVVKDFIISTSTPRRARR